MGQEKLFEVEQVDRYDHLTREELIEHLKVEKKIIVHLKKKFAEHLERYGESGDRLLLIEDQMVWLRNELFGKSSEKEPKQDTTTPKPKKPRTRRVQRLSERYPDLPRIARHLELQTAPDCRCCGVKLTDSGMTEDSEYLTVIPKQHFIIEQKRHKYRCPKCHGDLVTAPALSRITPGGSYSDPMILDVALSKYCDLIPINRYVRIAERAGVVSLPPQSLIESTHQLADFLKPAYRLLKEEIKAEKVLHADETPHRMLEGDETSNWYLWGFSSKKTSYFEAHNTRSGDVVSAFLKDCACEFLMSDVFSGYGKAVREANHIRRGAAEAIQNIYCNAHARRRFKEAAQRFPDDAQFFIEQYSEIYHLESLTPDKPPEEALLIRKKMKPLFEAMKQRATELIPQYPEKSYIGKAVSYLLGNYVPLTKFTDDARLPIDNNSQERLLRNPVIGRKTWYGTHSQRGSETMAILFSVIESCKLNKINPREFLPKLVQDLHEGKAPYTPASTLVN